MKLATTYICVEDIEKSLHFIKHYYSKNRFIAMIIAG